MYYFVLTLFIATLHGNDVFPVGLQYTTLQECERDFPRAAGMLERIMDNRYGANSSHVYARLCEQKQL